jgi:hypothetical protein
MRLVPLAIIVTAVLTLQDAAARSLADPLFESHDILKVSIIAPIEKIVRERSTEEFAPGTLRLVGSDGSTSDFDIGIRARGNFRRENCAYPPAWLKFKKSQVRGTVFENQKRIKLVVHCERSPRFEQILLREYLAYRMLNELTDNSFRVRLLRITYVDINDDAERPPRYAFLIEHKKRRAARLERKSLNVERTTVSALDPVQLNLTAVFQYFIGNTDFSPIAGEPGQSCCHNYVLLGDGENPVLPVPYDFDQSGFVGAPYASPSDRLPIRHVRTRLYRGRCVNNDQLLESLKQFEEKRNVIYALIANQVGLEPGTRRVLTHYMDGFFKLANNPQKLRQRLERGCL